MHSSCVPDMSFQPSLVLYHKYLSNEHDLKAHLSTHFVVLDILLYASQPSLYRVSAFFSSVLRPYPSGECKHTFHYLEHLSYLCTSLLPQPRWDVADIVACSSSSQVPRQGLPDSLGSSRSASFRFVCTSRSLTAAILTQHCP